jgi:hypothetical protein
MNSDANLKKLPLSLLFRVQARHIRRDLAEYLPFVWK